jgi:hypothetical protein
MANEIAEIKKGGRPGKESLLYAFIYSITNQKFVNGSEK